MGEPATRRVLYVEPQVWQVWGLFRVRRRNNDLGKTLCGERSSGTLQPWRLLAHDTHTQKRPTGCVPVLVCVCGEEARMNRHTVSVYYPNHPYLSYLQPRPPSCPDFRTERIFSNAWATLRPCGAKARMADAAMMQSSLPDAVMQQSSLPDAVVRQSSAETKALSLQQQLQQWPADVPQPSAEVLLLLEEAHHRWLKCAQVGQLLLNFKAHGFHASTTPPRVPTGAAHAL